MRWHPYCTAMPSWSDLEHYLQRNGWGLVRTTLGKERALREGKRPRIKFT